MWCKESNRYFGRIENLANGEINERGFSNSHPRTMPSNEYNKRGKKYFHFDVDVYLPELPFQY